MMVYLIPRCCFLLKSTWHGHELLSSDSAPQQVSSNTPRRKGLKQGLIKKIDNYTSLQNDITKQLFCFKLTWLKRSFCVSVYHFLTKPWVISTINLAWPHSRCFYSARVTHKKLNGYLLHTIGSNLRQYQFIDYFPKRAAIQLNSDYDIIFSAVNMGNRKICSVGYVRVPLA